MDIQNFITEFKKTFVYDMLCETLEDEQLFEHSIVGDNVIWFKEQTRQMWEMWQASANRAPKTIKANRKMVVAIEQMVEQQVEASGMDSNRLERLDGWTIFDAMIEAWEQSNES